MASHLIGDMSGSTIDDPLSERYKKLGCSISPLEKNSSDFDMIVNYLEKTYEPVKVGDVVRLRTFFHVLCMRMLISSLLTLFSTNFRNMGCLLRTSLSWNPGLVLPMKTL